MRRTIRWTAVLLALAALALPLPPALAVSYSPLYHLGDDPVLTTGQSLYLFHSGTEEMRTQLHIGDVLVVYRVSRSCEAQSVGKVRLVSFVEETYLEAVVIEGSVKMNDLARRGVISCLVLSAEPCVPR